MEIIATPTIAFAKDTIMQSTVDDDRCDPIPMEVLLDLISNDEMMCVLSITSTGRFETGTSLNETFDALLARTFPALDDSDLMCEAKEITKENLDWLMDQHMSISANQSIYTWVVPATLNESFCEVEDTPESWFEAWACLGQLPEVFRGVFTRRISEHTIEISTIASTIVCARRNIGYVVSERIRQYCFFTDAKIITFRVPICDIHLGTCGVTLPLPSATLEIPTNVNPHLLASMFRMPIRLPSEPVAIQAPKQQTTKMWQSKCDCGEVHDVPMVLLNDKALLSRNPALYCHTIKRVHCFYKECTDCKQLFFLSNTRKYTSCPRCTHK